MFGANFASEAHGIHPGSLTQGGLASALGALGARAPLPVIVDATTERLPPDIEATAYFVACEALTNVVKHAGASKATIRPRREDEMLVVEIEDNGAGGAAHTDGGTGLLGLADRVESHGGRLSIETAPGLGTRIVGEIPCVS